MKVLLFVIVLVFSVLGLCEFLHLLKCVLIFPKRQMKSTLVVMLKEETAIRQIIFAGEQYRWLGTKLAERVIVVAENISYDTLAECESLAFRYNFKFVVKG